MNSTPEPLLGAIHVTELNLWSHVGVLPKERLNGQAFLLDFSLWLNLDNASKNDELNESADYSVAIKRIQQLSMEINCLTIEHYSEKILDALESLYGAIPMRILLRKCSPPVDGFSGYVSIERRRYTQQLNERCFE